MKASSGDGQPEGAASEAPKSVVAQLRAHGLSAKKALGQNFLLDPSICRRIAEAATTPEGGTVLEVGPGLGALTGILCERAARVVAVERDAELVPILAHDLAAHVSSGKLEIVRGDALACDWVALLGDGPEPRTLAGNLPYLITGRLIEQAVALAPHIARAVVMVQLEVAARLTAKPSTKEYGALSVFVQAAFRVERLLIARSGAFYPRPDVDSAVVTLERLTPPRGREDAVFRALVKGGFATRRKTLRNSLKGVLGLAGDVIEAAALAEAIDLGRRGETLSVEEYEALAERLRPIVGVAAAR